MKRRDLLTGATATAAAFAVGGSSTAAAGGAYIWSRPIVNGGHGHLCVFDPVTGEATFGGDVWGYHYTNDIFGEWSGCMAGQSGIGGIYSRGLAPSLLNPGTRYVGVGTLKSPGGFFGVSVGNALRSRSTALGFGTALVGSAGSPDPRPAGRLIDVTMIGGVETIWAAGHQGVAMSADQGLHWTTPHGPTGSGQAWKAVCALSASQALACRWLARGLYLVTAAGVTQIADPGVIHSINRIGGVVWACGPSGLYQWDGSKLVAHPGLTGIEVSDIDGSVDGRTLFACTANQTVAAKDAYKSVDGGNTWVAIGQNAKPTLFNGKPFWLQNVVHNHFGDTNWSGTQVAVNPLDPSMVLFAGKNGGAGTKDGGATIYQCAPGGDEVKGVRAGPGANQFTCTDTDWTGVTTSDGWQTYAKTTTPGTVSTSLSASAGGHSYTVKTSGVPRDILKDGVSIADDVFRGTCVQPTGIAVSSDGTITVSLFTGGVLVGRPV